MQRLLALALGLFAICTPSAAAERPSADSTRQIAEEAFIYGFPLVMNYAVFYEYFFDKASPQYKTSPSVKAVEIVRAVGAAGVVRVRARCHAELVRVVAAHILHGDAVLTTPGARSCP